MIEFINCFTKVEENLNLLSEINIENANINEETPIEDLKEQEGYLLKDSKLKLIPVNSEVQPIGLEPSHSLLNRANISNFIKFSIELIIYLYE